MLHQGVLAADTKVNHSCCSSLRQLSPSQRVSWSCAQRAACKESRTEEQVRKRSSGHAHHLQYCYSTCRLQLGATCQNWVRPITAVQVIHALPQHFEEVGKATQRGRLCKLRTTVGRYMCES